MHSCRLSLHDAVFNFWLYIVLTSVYVFFGFLYSHIPLFSNLFDLKVNSYYMVQQNAQASPITPCDDVGGSPLRWIAVLEYTVGNEIPQFLISVV